MPAVPCPERWVDQNAMCLVQVSEGGSGVTGEALGVSYSSDLRCDTPLLLAWPRYYFTLVLSCLLRL